MPLFSPADARFLEALSKLVYANPFLPQRIELERQALGEAFVPSDASAWSRRADIDDRPNTERLEARAIEVADAAREALAAGNTRASDKQLELYEDAALYVLYDRFRLQLHAAIEPPAQSVEVAGPSILWPQFKQAFEHYLQIPGVALPSRYEAPHIFAGYFQIRRAFHHIFDYIIGRSRAAVELRAAIWQSIFTHDMHRYWQTLYRRMGDFSTLISGPSGTGKELVARAIGLSRYIPFNAKRRQFVDEFAGSFHPLSLAALSPTLIESELFGHRRGAFTGAIADRAGWLEVCKPTGTVFLDEIGELDAAIQVKLLRVVQSRVFHRLGESKECRFEGKIIAATNRDLADEMRAGRFREDLYYRLCSDLVTTAPLQAQLADAPEDLHALVQFATRNIVGDDAQDLADEVIRWIEANLSPDYAWPGNIRELEQCVRNCLVRGQYQPSVAQQDTLAGDNARDWLAAAQAGQLTADELLRHYCTWVHAQLGTYEATAARLGLDRRTVRRKVDRVVPQGNTPKPK